jgi:hypothetical protein
VRASRFILGIAALAAGSLEAQQSSRTQPVTGLRDNSTGYHALVGARVVTAPGQALDNATIVVRNGVITAVGAGLSAPPVPACGTSRGSRSIPASSTPRRTSVAMRRRRGATWAPRTGIRRCAPGSARRPTSRTIPRDASRFARSASAPRSRCRGRGSSAAALRCSTSAMLARASASCAPTSRRRSVSSAPSRWAGCTPTRRWGRLR